jgi:hypothetical protein
MKTFVATVLFVLIVGLGIFASAQAPAPTPGIVSGPDIGFRVERTLPDRAVGTLMVRVNGQWVEAWVSGKGGIVPLQVK